MTTTPKPTTREMERLVAVAGGEMPYTAVQARTTGRLVKHGMLETFVGPRHGTTYRMVRLTDAGRAALAAAREA